jgi:DUF4097 and DUF4098 domain-containing protein YvlB
MIEIVLLKVTLLLALTGAVTHALRGRSAATRHFVWCAALFGTLAIAVVERTAPPVKVVMPAEPEVITVSEPVTAHGTNVGRASARPALTEREGRAEARPTLSMLYAGGVLFVLLWRVVGHFALARVTRRSEAANGFRFSEEVSAPVTWGWRRPVILLPVEAKEWPAERVEAALLHERAHIARADWLTQTLAQLVVALYWFHPLVWVAMRRLRAESEHACDDRVIAGGMTAPDYASHLLAVAHGALERRHGAIAGVAMARPSQFESRLIAVLDETRSRGLVARRIAAAASLLIAVVLVPIAFARAESRVSVVKQNVAGTSGHSVPAAAGETLTLDLETGASVDVTGWDEARVDVAVLFRDDDAEETKVDVARAGNGVRVHSFQTRPQSNGTSLRMLIRTPRRFNLQLRSAGGDVVLTDLEGSFRGTTGGGEIRIERVRGSANLTTGGGEVHVVDSHLEGDVTTGAGEVNIERSHLVNGVSGNPGQAKKKDRLEKSGGDVYLSDVVDKSIITGGGDIEIARGSGVIDASTGGGNVRLRAMSGSVNASTGAGNVEVTMTDAESVDITTGSGSVVLELPAGFDGVFELETSYTASFGRETRINTDWNLQQDGPGGWDSSHGTPRRIITARGTAGSGRGRVRVRAVNGDVTVRRK